MSKLLLYSLVTSRESPLPFHPKCKKFCGFKWLMSMVDNPINICAFSVHCTGFHFHCFHTLWFALLRCLRFNKVRKPEFFISFMYFYLLGFYPIHSLLNTTECCSWEMLKMEIDSVEDKKKKNGKNNMYQ